MAKDKLRYGMTKSRAGHGHVWACIGTQGAVWRSGRMEPYAAQRLCRAIGEADLQTIKYSDTERSVAPLLEMLTALEPVAQAPAVPASAVVKTDEGNCEPFEGTPAHIVRGDWDGAVSEQAQRVDKIVVEFTRAELNQVSIALAGREMKLADAITFVEQHLSDDVDSNARFLTDVRAQQDAAVKLHVKVIKLLTGGE